MTKFPAVLAEEETFSYLVELIIKKSSPEFHSLKAGRISEGINKRATHSLSSLSARFQGAQFVLTTSSI
jgi:hypothetical protein